MCEKLKVASKINTNEHDSDNRRNTDILLSCDKPVSNHTNYYEAFIIIVNNNLILFLFLR